MDLSIQQYATACRCMWSSKWGIIEALAAETFIVIDLVHTVVKIMKRAEVKKIVTNMYCHKGWEVLKSKN